MKTIIVIQARTGSTRFPGKVMLPLAGAPLLQRMVERVQTITGKVECVVATTTDISDDPIRKLCKKINVKCFSGHPTDLLDRHYKAAKEEQADFVIKIPSDCPLIDPAVIERILRFHHNSIRHYDYISNLHPASYPDGNDVELMTIESLEIAWNEAKKKYEREHTTPFLWENPNRFKIGNIAWEAGLDYSMSHRWTIDYQEDYDFIKRVYNELWTPNHPGFSLYEILGLLVLKPELCSINQKYVGVNWYRHHLNDLKTISAKQTKQPVNL